LPAVWPTYHRTDDRRGDVVGATRPSSLRPQWSTSLDGAVYGQPLVVGSFVIAATENDSVYALDMHSGAVRWHTKLGAPVPLSALPCGDIDPLGITGTPAYDVTTGSLFVVTETAGGVHDLVALDATNGARRWSRNLDVSGRDPLAEQQRGALAVGGGRVYVPFGGLYGDCGNYVGYVTAVSVNGTGAVSHYNVPTAREGGVWAPSGPAVASDGTVFIAVGNGAASSGPYDGSDAVMRLAPDLSARLDFFAPSAWAAQNGSDQDLGSTGPLLLQNGDVMAAGKDGYAYLLNASHLGGIGGQLAAASGCTGFGGMAADGAAVFVPCNQGLRRFDVASNHLTARWATSFTGSPVVGGGAVWALDTGAGVLHAVDETTGADLARVSVGNVTRFASPVVVPHLAIVGTTGGVVAVAY
jgi:outer membrane protein assembly factor BamB